MPCAPPPPAFAVDEVSTTEDESSSAASTDDDADLDAPARKRRKREHGGARSRAATTHSAETPVRDQRQLRSLERVVSPPLARKTQREDEDEGETEDEDDAEPERRAVKKVGEAGSAAKEVQQEALNKGEKAASSSAPESKMNGGERRSSTTFVSSPIQLTRIRDLPQAANIDTVALEDILCDPLIVEVWQFNYLFDVDFVMGALDEDVRSSVRVKVVHGSWRREDAQRKRMEAWAAVYPNLEVIQAYMPETFGTHHSKMMILIRADDYAQVVIHTANMITKDWTNMTNAVWRSPLLPLLPAPAQVSQPQVSQNNSESSPPDRAASTKHHPMGSGERFKVDLLHYLDAYGRRLKALSEKLVHYDFSDVRAALVASTPSRVKLNDAKPNERTSWGWVGFREVLRQIPQQSSASGKRDEDSLIVAQVSSIATLDQTGAWLENFGNVLGTRGTGTPSPPTSTTSKSPPRKLNAFPAFRPASSLLTSPSASSSTASSAPFSPLCIIFPTVSDIRTSLDGYYSGASIHLKTQSTKQQKQLSYMRPKFCRWSTTFGSEPAVASALRGSAASHIKTYIRYAHPKGSALGSAGTRIEWAMLTSANLSMQAWGALPSVDGGARKTRAEQTPDERGKEVRICSWEIGVIVWPELIVGSVRGDGTKQATMVPVFGRDGPGLEHVVGLENEGKAEKGGGGEKVVTGWRMPYDLPLMPYGKDDEPWCATARYAEPDVRGCAWDGF